MAQQALWQKRLQLLDRWDAQQKRLHAEEAARQQRSNGAVVAALILQAAAYS